MFQPVYLDANATTRLDPEVREAMLPWLATYANPSSRHAYGRAARSAIDTARAQVAEAVGASPGEIVFTSGGSEANNLFIKGVAACHPPGVFAVSAVEHPSVLKAARQLARQGWRIEILPVDGEGRLDAAGIEAVCTQKPLLGSVMQANNETGVLVDVAGVARRFAEQRAPGRFWLHSDAVQALGKQKLDFRALNQAGVHALSLSAHKIGGPQGAGALVLDKRIELEALIAGGGQERGRRSGTENVAAIVGFGLACRLAEARRAAGMARLADLRARLENGLLALGATVFGAGAPRLANTTFFAFAGLEGETLVGRLDRAGFAVASGSACSSTDPGASHVLLAMGVPENLARGALRVSLTLETSAENIDQFLAALGATVHELQGFVARAAGVVRTLGATA